MNSPITKIDLFKNLLWPTCIYTVNWNLHSVYAEDIKKNIDNWSENNVASEIASTVKTHLYESGFNYFDQDFNPLNELERFCVTALAEVCKDINSEVWTKERKYGVKITESWFHITKNHGHHDAHSHPMHSWSGIYYLDLGETQIATKNGINRFYAPFKSEYLDRGNQYLTNIWDVDPKNGMLVIFPSYIYHSALPYKGKINRYVIAFNARVEDVI